ncbi:MAG: hypothetical protein JWQ43_4050 [Glaciihabitans sp.]|nr:hypothetical protein [Glaciihabitans sp.]
MVTRREVALRLDIPLEMAHRHGIPPRLSEAEFTEIDTNPPAWLAQSRANRTGKKPVWVTLTCDICGFSEAARPKKWWPQFTYLSCEQHGADELPEAEAGSSRNEFDGIGSRFIGIVDETPQPDEPADASEASGDRPD